jgi:probable H4MPT-linked C1 transfer pathway protein
MAIVAGYDVGGAHLKIALVEDGRTISAQQIPCPLWLGLDRLEAALEAARQLAARARHHAVTMTAELCDIFPDRRTGVCALVAKLSASLGPAMRYWCGARGFCDAEETLREPLAAASANFLASAALAARHHPECLLVDMGSTTVDIVAVADGQVHSGGLTDAERLESGGLVYTGLTRTPIMAIVTRTPFQGRWQGLAQEYFATIADARRILGELPDDVDQHETADKRGKSVEESIARFARMFGRDGADGNAGEWRAAARAVTEAQLRSIHDALLQRLSATRLSEAAPVIAAGIGAPVVRVLADRLGRATIDFADLAGAADACRVWAGRCAPAVAVALLLDA